jgi:hypothetical protein
MEADFVVASQLRGFLSEELVDYNLPELEDRIDEDIQFNTVVWCCGLQRIVPWFASPLEQEYQGTMRWRYANMCTGRTGFTFPALRVSYVPFLHFCWR